MGFFEEPFDTDDAERDMENGFAVGVSLVFSWGGSDEGMIASPLSDRAQLIEETTGENNPLAAKE